MTQLEIIQFTLDKRIRGYNGSNDKDHSQRKTTSKTFMSLKTNGQHSQSETSEQLVTSSSSETAIKEFHEAYEKAFECGNCLNNLANIMLIGPNHEGKSFIYKSLTKQTESYFNNAPVLINLDALTQASNSDEEIILDRQSFIDRKVLSVIEEQGNISVSPELQRIFSTTLQSNDQTNNAKSIAISGSDKVSVHNSDIDCQLNDNNTKVVETRTNILNLLNKDSNPLSSPLLSRCFQKFHQRRKYNHDSHFAKVWNFDNHAYYQPFKFQHNLYIAPFDVSVELDKIVRGGHSIDCYDYVTSFQEWLINTIDWNTNENQIYVEIGSQEENIPLPVILLVATNRDEKLEEQVQWARRKQFMDELDIKMPRHQLHFYSPEIIITLNDGNQKNNLEKTVNDRSWSELCRIIDAFILNFPFFKRRIKLKWYILAESFLTISIRDKTIDNTPNNNNCGGKEYIQTLQQISTKANNQLEPEEITKVLEFLHGIGDILFSSRSQADGLLIADIHWFIDNLNKISTLVGEEHHLANSGSSRKYCKWAKDYGMITKASVRYATHKKMLEEKDINSLLQVMLQNHLIYKFTRNLEKKPSSKSEQYFFPRLLPLGNIKSGNESSCGFQSTWLYLGFDENVLLYVTDQIFYQFLLLSQSKLDVEVLIYYDSAKYLPKHHNYAIIVNKKGSRIRIQYCYKTIGEQETDLKIKKEAISALNNDQLHIHLKKLLSEIVKNAYPETQEVDCEYFIDCPSCHQLMMICSSHFVTKIIECTNIKCCAKYLLAIMKDWISVLHESSSPCKNAQSLTSNQDVTSPNPSIASMCDEEDNPKLLANRVEESYNTNSSVNYNTPSPKRKASEIG
ncbi:hypothetical protein TrispH2_011654 [Trichoplax sp. H2]|nr:hypothetical protein TrispH2_011654 [Trichoplax sp. H2]|eukprot:RDD36311.1 hypothetical protein TrispH2_011654 [Trichoplax sp. H2]